MLCSHETQPGLALAVRLALANLVPWAEMEQSFHKKLIAQ